MSAGSLKLACESDFDFLAFAFTFGGGGVSHGRLLLVLGLPANSCRPLFVVRANVVKVLKAMRCELFADDVRHSVF
jgi:hypothetical protein